MYVKSDTDEKDETIVLIYLNKGPVIVLDKNDKFELTSDGWDDEEEAIIEFIREMLE